MRVRLPDRFGQRLPDETGIAWYRLRLPRPDTSALCGLYLPHVHPNAVVYLNGEWLGQGGPFDDPQGRVWNRPLYFPFPSERLQERDNWLEIGVRANGSVFDALDPVILGPDALVRPKYDRAFFLRIGIAQASTVLGAVMAFFFAIVGIALRDPRYLWFAASAGFFCVNNSNYHWQQPPFEYWNFNALVYVSLAWMSASFGMLVVVLLERSWRYARWALATFAAGTAMAALILPGPDFERISIVTSGVSTAIPLAGLLSIIALRPPDGEDERWVYVGMGVLMVPMGVHDFWLQLAKQSDALSLPSLPLVPYLGPALLLGFCTALLLRFLRVYRQSRAANVELERRVAEKHAELAASFSQMRHIEQQRVVLQERERMTREMHDGLGGHLVTMLAMVQHDEVRGQELAEALRDALDEMRLVIHSLDPWADDIPGLLASMRARLEPRLESRGLRFRWAVGDLPPLPRLGPSEILEILRIVQESITNALKHSGARSIRIESGTRETADGSYAFIEIRDDGKGLCGPKPSGRGLSNMQMRAARLGGTVEVESMPDGTAVRLRVPVKRWQ